jgi:hypothetical protein
MIHVSEYGGQAIRPKPYGYTLSPPTQRVLLGKGALRDNLGKGINKHHPKRDFMFLQELMFPHPHLITRMFGSASDILYKCVLPLVPNYTSPLFSSPSPSVITKYSIGINHCFISDTDDLFVLISSVSSLYDASIHITRSFNHSFSRPPFRICSSPTSSYQERPKQQRRRQ